MDKLRIAFYNIFSKKLKNKLGKSKILKPFRDLLFRKKGTYREIETKIKRQYLDYNVSFNFIASLQIALKAKERGFENTLLRNSIQLLKKYKKRDKEDYIVFDVGTNFGYLSLVWAKTVCKHGKVYSFEPHPKLFNSFLKSISLNQLDKIIFANNLAISDKKGKIEVNLSSTTSNILSINNENLKIKKQKIEMTTLDLFKNKNKLLNCDLVKIDVDGIELDILNGSIDLIKEFQPIFIVETNNDSRIIEFFENQKYTILNMNLKPILKGELPLNIFCLPKFN